MLNTAQNGIGSMELRGQAAKRFSGGARSACHAFSVFSIGFLFMVRVLSAARASAPHLYQD